MTSVQPETEPTTPKPEPKPVKRKFTGKRKAKPPIAKAKAPPKAKPAALAVAADSAVIKWLGKDHAFRAESGRAERVARLQKHSGKTVELFLKAGGRRSTIARCLGLGLIALK